MYHYIITYFGGDEPKSQEESQKNFALYQKWLDSLEADEVLVKPMVPYSQVHSIHPNGETEQGSFSQMSGHTIIQAESILEAVEYAQTCPFLATNGRIEVAQVVQMEHH